MKLRSQVSEEEREQNAKKKKPRIEKETLPYIQFKGKVVYHTDFIGCAMVCDELMKIAETSEDPLVLGFDLEWPFSFQTGSGKTALIQISPNLDLAYLLHVSEIKKLPIALPVLLSHKNVRLTGNNIKNDIRKLARDFNINDAEKMIENCIDTGVFANQILSSTQRWSLERLVAYLLHMRISKDKKVRMSKWSVIPLSKEQKLYAATDSYASLKVYLRIKELQADPAQIENLPIILRDF